MTNNHPTPQPHPDREEIARIIDPYAFHPSATLNPNIHVQSVVLAKADSILAKIGSPSTDDRDELRDALHDLVMLHAQDDIGCVPAPTKAQWEKAWAAAEELVRIEP